MKVRLYILDLLKVSSTHGVVTYAIQNVDLGENVPLDSYTVRTGVVHYAARPQDYRIGNDVIVQGSLATSELEDSLGWPKAVDLGEVKRGMITSEVAVLNYIRGGAK